MSEGYEAMSEAYEKMMEKKNFLPFQLDYLTPRMIEIAKEELNENENTRSSSIEQLRKLVIKEKNLRCRTDDEFLLQFLRARKFDVKKAFTRLQAMHKVTSKSFPDVFANVDEERATKAFGYGFACHLPYRDQDGAAVAFCKISNWNTEEFDIVSVLNCLAAVAVSAVDYPATQVCGLYLLGDFRGTTWQHLRCAGPRFLYLISKAFQDSLPIRLKGIHLINASAPFRYGWAFFSIFLSQKLRKRVHFHDENMENLHKFIPKEILPKEYGGDNPTFDPVKQGSAELEKFRPKFLQMRLGGYMKD